MIASLDGSRAVHLSVVLLNVLTDRWRQVASGRAGLVVCFVWAIAEATVWPVIPDVALFLLIIAVPQRAFKLALATATGSAIGGMMTVSVSALAPSVALAMVLHVPLIHVRSIATVHQYLGSHSLLIAFLHQPWSGIPFKLWAVLAVAGGHQPLPVVLCFVFGRTVRFAAVTLVAFALGRLVARSLRDIALPLLLIVGPPAVVLFYRIAIAG
jgi:membrane protein YqaA with SNARE-associated domain